MGVENKKQSGVDKKGHGGVNELKLAFMAMTPIQRRRYKYYIKGWSLTRIARKEGVSVEAIRKSIRSSENGLKKRFKGLKRG